ncbi:MAG: FAD-dependent monooxygenase [Colwellia sp.]|nr:FAD-dependent monooxygenase [Colwellia sp.]
MREFKERAAAKAEVMPVVIVGAGPVGLALAVDLAQRNIEVVLVDQKTAVGKGSRAVTFAKRTLEIFDKLGIGEAVVQHGTQWSISRTYYKDEMIDAKNLQPEEGLKRPAYVNIQQYHIEDYLVKRALQLPQITMCWGTTLLSHQQNEDDVVLTLSDPQGEYQLKSKYLIAADGANSPIRNALSLPFKGQKFKDRFLIVDVVMAADFSPERHFWFSPSFHEGHSVLLHKQPDDIWRVDFQLGWDCDPQQEIEEERVQVRLKKMLGEDVNFDIKWLSVYTFECRKLTNFKEGKVIFIGDAAHRVSPFGARGANSGFQDADNLSWKLEQVITGRATEALLETYNEERQIAARENIAQSSRSTDFITPKSEQSFRFRNAILTLAKKHRFAKNMINSGRLSTATDHLSSSINATSDDFSTGILPGQVCIDSPIVFDHQQKWLLDLLANKFTIIHFGSPTESLIKEFDLLTEIDANLQLIIVVEQPPLTLQIIPRVKVIFDAENILTQRLNGKLGVSYLLRPDNYVAGRWHNWQLEKLDSALRGCLL